MSEIDFMFHALTKRHVRGYHELQFLFLHTRHAHAHTYTVILATCAVIGLTGKYIVVCRTNLLSWSLRLLSVFISGLRLLIWTMRERFVAAFSFIDSSRLFLLSVIFRSLLSRTVQFC